MDARVIFTKDFKEKAEQGLSAREKGKLRWEKLQEAAEEGRLQLAKNRYEVAALVGLSSRNSACYQWVSNLIRRENLQEMFIGFEDGHAIYEYRLGRKQPYGRRKKRAKKQVANKPVSSETNKVAKPATKLVEEKIPEVIKVEITKGEITIKIELTSSEQVSELITTVLKGGKNEQDITTSYGANGTS